MKIYKTHYTYIYLLCAGLLEVVGESCKRNKQTMTIHIKFTFVVGACVKISAN